MTSRKEVRKGLEDAEYRRAWKREYVSVGLAFQLRALRESRGWTQTKLGELTGTRQETLSQWENPNYGKYTISTLLRLSDAYDVGLQVRLVPFDELINWTVDTTPERLAPPSFEDEPKAQKAHLDMPSDSTLESHFYSYGNVVEPTPDNVIDILLYRDRKVSASSEGEEVLGYLPLQVAQ